MADLSAERYQLLRRAATLAVACEDLEARLASGEQIDWEVYSRGAQQQRLYFAGRDSPASTARTTRPSWSPGRTCTRMRARRRVVAS